MVTGSGFGGGQFWGSELRVHGYEGQRVILSDSEESLRIAKNLFGYCEILHPAILHSG